MHIVSKHAPTYAILCKIQVYLLVFIHLEDTISFSPFRCVKSLLPSPLSVPSPFDVKNERNYTRQIRSLADNLGYLCINLAPSVGFQHDGSFE